MTLSRWTVRPLIVSAISLALVTLSTTEAQANHGGSCEGPGWHACPDWHGGCCRNDEICGQGDQNNGCPVNSCCAEDDVVVVQPGCSMGGQVHAAGGSGGSSVADPPWWLLGVLLGGMLVLRRRTDHRRGRSG